MQLTLDADHNAVIAGETVKVTAAGRILRRVAGPVARHHVPGRRVRTTGARDDRSLRERHPLREARARGADPRTTRAGASASRRRDPKAPRSRRIGSSSSSRPPTTLTRAATSEAAGCRSSDRSTRSISRRSSGRSRPATWDGDAAGAAVGGKRITASTIELVPVRRRVGNDYDFIEKVVRPRYEYDIQRKPVGTRTVTSGADGRSGSTSRSRTPTTNTRSSCPRRTAPGASSSGR